MINVATNGHGTNMTSQRKLSHRVFKGLLALVAILAAAGQLPAEELVPRIDQRFAGDTEETPTFRQHVVPLFGKLGCNGRACHGSFQGQGDFRLSLFGYDFAMDHESLTSGEEPRADTEFPEDSLMLMKPTLTLPHEGGRRMEVDGWEYRVLRRWVESGAKGVGQNDAEFVRLEVTPDELVFSEAGETSQLQAVAVWSDGTREDVTPLCRFQTNNEQVAGVTEGGLITSGEPGDTHVVVFYDTGVIPIPILRPVSDSFGPNYPSVPTPTAVDTLVVEKLRKLGLVQSETCTDAEFLRRVSLDMTGTLPTASEVEHFLSDSSSDKRARKIDELLERPAYVAWWTTRLCDITGNNDDALTNVTPIRGGSSRDWYDWIHRRVEQNVPYDELVEGIVLGTGREGDESYLEYSTELSAIYAKGGNASFADRDTMPHYWARRTVRQPADKALSFAYAFLGIRIQCAQCHKHPFDRWTQDDYKQFTNFFTRVRFGNNPESRKEYVALINQLDLKGKRGNDLRRQLRPLLADGKVVPFEEVYVAPPRQNNRKGKQDKNDKQKRRRGAPAPANGRLLGGDVVNLNEHDDPRQALMDWLREEDNPFFARAFVNRVWAAYFNVGIVEPPDDLSLANPPSNRALLDYLASEFVAHGYDMKWLHREIANSRTYQLSWQPNDTNRLDERNFSHAVPRRLPAEVAYDVLQQATASDAESAAMQQTVAERAIAIPGAGQRNRRGPKYALTIFGKSDRESNCDCDRSNESSLLQTIFLRNDQETLAMIDRKGDGWLAQLSGDIAGARKQARGRNEQARGAAADRQRLKRLRANLARFKEAGETKKAELVQERLAQMQQRIRREAQRNPQKKNARVEESAEQSEAAEINVDAAELVRQAYLRTLSRPPAGEELARAEQHLEQAESTLDGLRDLLWALINTKEFIVNH